MARISATAARSPLTAASAARWATLHTLEVVCDDGPPKSFVLRAGTVAVIPQGAWHRLLSSEGATQMAVTPFPGETIELDVDDPREAAR